jgi:hypothetical protein
MTTSTGASSDGTGGVSGRKDTSCLILGANPIGIGLAGRVAEAGTETEDEAVCTVSVGEVNDFRSDHDSRTDGFVGVFIDVAEVDIGVEAYGLTGRSEAGCVGIGFSSSLIMGEGVEVDEGLGRGGREAKPLGPDGIT